MGCKTFLFVGVGEADETQFWSLFVFCAGVLAMSVMIFCANAATAGAIGAVLASRFLDKVNSPLLCRTLLRCSRATFEPRPSLCSCSC